MRPAQNFARAGVNIQEIKGKYSINIHDVL